MVSRKDIRGELKRLMEATLADEAANHTWTYRAVRPLVVPSTWKAGQTITGDCSKGVQFLCGWAGAPDPMGAAYGPYGNSQTIWLHAQHAASASELQVGDAVTFGRNGDEHAAMVLEAGLDPLVWSFGHQGAPNSYRISQDHREKQFCKLPIQKYTPTPEDNLKAKTGWFAWVAWRLGEGDWRQYGKANARVRPDVPAHIPASWWQSYAKFILSRKKGNEANG